MNTPLFSEGSGLQLVNLDPSTGAGGAVSSINPSSLRRILAYPIVPVCRVYWPIDNIPIVLVVSFVQSQLRNRDFKLVTYVIAI